MKTQSLAILLFTILSLMSSAVGAQSEVVARVIVAMGNAVIVKANGIRQPLNRGDEIQVGDRIDNAEDGVVQLRFIDSAIVALGCNSSLGINAYRFQSGMDDRVELILLAGAFRTIEGSIASEFYSLLLADTVIRGIDADFEVALAEDGTQYFGAYNGAIAIEYAQREFRLGSGANADFGRLVPDLGFDELVLQPPLLGQSAIIFPANPANSYLASNANCAN